MQTTPPESAPTPAFTVLIPARLASTRLPDKPLADLGGAPMVVRVAQRARLSQAARCVVAADHDAIVKACSTHGVEAVLTRGDHPSGSDRLAEACTRLGLADDAIVVNVQGDEPLIEPALIDAVARLLVARPDAAMGTAAHPIDSVADFTNPNVVKVVLDARQLALYFSRAPIPWWRDGFADSLMGRLLGALVWLTLAAFGAVFALSLLIWLAASISVASCSKP